jgi:hypothetical protein
MRAIAQQCVLATWPLLRLQPNARGLPLCLLNKSGNIMNRLPNRNKARNRLVVGTHVGVQFESFKAHKWQPQSKWIAGFE